MHKEISDPVNLTVLSGRDFLRSASWMPDRVTLKSWRERSLVIADTGVEDIDLLLGQLAPGTDLWRIESSTDVGSLLEKALSGGYDRLHFLGHGEPGAITLGGRPLRVDDFTVLPASESASAPSLHFWSCLTGAGAKGRAFVDGVAKALGGVVTAFSGLVGAESKGGSWLPDVFSHQSGFVAVPFSGALDYGYTLATVSTVAITGATGIQNSTLNAGDVVRVTVTFDAGVDVTGSPQLALTIGGATVNAVYNVGDATNVTTIVFEYTIIADQTDVDGISIDVNGITLNGGTIKDTTTLIDSVLTYAAVDANAGYLVDTAAPATTAEVTGVADNAGYITGNVTTGGVTDDTTLVL
ncbi:MAG: DUF4347 domain-containing protein, partial [Chlorobiaceae bacterium]|nr:DUF4347 domain-containing protein [Chlorobiaceae bacterium]